MPGWSLERLQRTAIIFRAMFWRAATVVEPGDRAALHVASLAAGMRCIVQVKPRHVHAFAPGAAEQLVCCSAKMPSPHRQMWGPR